MNWFHISSCSLMLDSDSHLSGNFDVFLLVLLLSQIGSTFALWQSWMVSKHPNKELVHVVLGYPVLRIIILWSRLRCDHCHPGGRGEKKASVLKSCWKADYSVLLNILRLWVYSECFLYLSDYLGLKGLHRLLVVTRGDYFHFWFIFWTLRPIIFCFKAKQKYNS